MAVAAAGGTLGALAAGGSHGGSGSGTHLASSHRPTTAASGPGEAMIPAPPIGSRTEPAPVGATGVSAKCTGPATGDTLSQEPTSIVIACADGGLALQSLRWTSWGATSATATGTFSLNLCTPDCAAGKLAYYPAVLTLSDVVDSAGGPAFTVVSLTYPDGGPRTVSGQVMSRFTLWYPGVRPLATTAATGATAA